MMFEKSIQAIARVLQKDPGILFITGAGISADSGLPTYRGVGGLYDVDVTEEGYAIETILSGSMFKENPALTWKYLYQIRNSAVGATFNRGHQIIAEMEQEFSRVWTLTQNIDGFHSKAGAENMIEIHGNMTRVLCTQCHGSFLSEQIDQPDDFLPRCPECSGLVRPNVVLFDEMLPDAALNCLREQVGIGFGLVVSIGTSSAFPYIQEPIYLAKQQGNPTVEINPSETSLSREVDYCIPLGATEALETIWSAYRELKKEPA
jgi:NAD-dependent deacetylase